MPDSQYPNYAHYLYTQKSNGCVHDLNDAYPIETEQTTLEIDRFTEATYAASQR